MKESRLFRIVYILLDRGLVSASILAEELEVSIRTIYRDIDSLSASGIPIYTEIGRNGGISLLENYTFDKTLLSLEERKNIIYSLQSISSFGENTNNEILTKLAALFNLKSSSWFEVDFTRWGNDDSDANKFEQLKEAIINNREVTIHYMNSKGCQAIRDIQPLKMVYKSKYWYIKAFCKLKNDFRIFKINRILKLSVSNTTFEPITFPIAPDYQVNKVHNITLYFNKNIAYRVYDEFDAASIKVLENKDLIVNTLLPEDAWLIGYLLSFGGYVKVIKPKYLQDIIAKEALKIIEINKD